MKIYQKKSGTPNFKEKRLIQELEVALAKRDIEELEGFPARTYEELVALHDKYYNNFDDYQEVTEDNQSNEQKTENMAGKETPRKTEPTGESKPTFLDPFNDAEPIVRDYVLSDGFQDPNAEPQPSQSTFGEPTSFEESFELPTDEDEKAPSKAAAKEKKEKKPDQPLNPRFDDMTDNKKKRSTKKLAKMIVEGTCLLAEKGCIWWTTKDITEDKLVQYELDNVMDLQILLTLDEGQQITVREWFRGRVAEAQTLYKVSKDDKDDLIDSLYEVLLEKGVAPTPMQELMINAVKTFVLDMGLKAFAMQQQIKSVLTQLKAMQKNNQIQTEEINFDDVDTEEMKNPAVEDTYTAQPETPQVSETELQ